MAGSSGPFGRLVAPGRLDATSGGDWLLLRLLVRGLALVPLAIGLVLAVVRAYVASHRGPDGRTKRGD